MWESESQCQNELDSPHRRYVYHAVFLKELYIYRSGYLVQSQLLKDLSQNVMYHVLMQ